MEYKKPPLGIISNKIWKLNRLEELEKAIYNRLNTEFEIPYEWIKERNGLLKEVM